MPNIPTLLDSFLAPPQITVAGVPQPYWTTWEMPGVTVADDPANERIIITIGAASAPPPIVVSFGNAGGASAQTIASGSRIWRVVLVVTTAFPGGSLNLGSAGNATALLAGVDLSIVGTFAYDMIVSWISTLPVIATVLGAPAAGAAEVLVQQGPVTT